MKILVVGSGGREHALVWKISQSPKVSKLYCAPGNAGIESLAQCVPVKLMDLDGLLNFAKQEMIDLTVVGPEQPLAEGIVDLFNAHGLMIFGPSKRAAELEWSKGFAKAFMHRHGIPTAAYRIFGSGQRVEAQAYVRRRSRPLVVKADGLAAGKGVIICQSHEEAVPTIREMMEKKIFGPSGETIVVEDFLEGEEASVFAISDGTRYLTLAPAQDHKRALDGDRGKNTGGMGAYAPAPIVTPDLLQVIEEKIIEPTLKGMAQENRPYVGCLYLGLMLTREGLKVVEFNSRFGDPEAQVVLPLFNGDLVEVLLAACRGELGSVTPQRRSSTSGAAVCVVLASGGYPDQYSTGMEISGLDDVARMPDVLVFHAGTARQNGKLATAGGRVLGVTAMQRNGSMQDAIDLAYQAVGKVSFTGMHFRYDIGKKALAHEQRSLA